MSKQSTYNKYSQTELIWLKQFPSHWKELRVKNLGKVVLGKMLKSNAEENYELKYYLKSKNIGWLNVNVDSVEEMYFSKREMKQYRIKQNDLLLSEGGEVGKTCIWNNEIDECYLQNSVHKITFNKHNNPKYFLYLSFILGQLKYYDSVVNQVSIKHLTWEKLINISFIAPPLEEQTTIAQYLDTKNQAIDKKVNLLTQKINYYKELRKSIINDVVCKGLDKNVKVQEIEFAFSVNANWKRYRLKDLGFLYSGLSGKAGDDFNQDDNPNNKGFIPFTNIANNTYLKANHLGTVVVYENEKQNKVRKGDLFFLMSSEGYDDVGKTAVLAEDMKDTYLNSFCKGYRITKKNCAPYFLNYLLLSDNYRKSLITEGKGFTRINLKMEKVTDFFVYLPPTIEEQTAIVKYLDEKTQKIDAIVTNIRKQIETLKELRKTLINDVVTGKIKVN